MQRKPRNKFRPNQDIILVVVDEPKEKNDNVVGAKEQPTQYTIDLNAVFVPQHRNIVSSVLPYLCLSDMITLKRINKIFYKLVNEDITYQQYNNVFDEASINILIYFSYLSNKNNIQDRDTHDGENVKDFNSSSVTTKYSHIFDPHQYFWMIYIFLIEKRIKPCPIYQLGNKTDDKKLLRYRTHWIFKETGINNNVAYFYLYYSLGYFIHDDSIVPMFSQALRQQPINICELLGLIFGLWNSSNNNKFEKIVKGTSDYNDISNARVINATLNYFKGIYYDLTNNQEIILGNPYSTYIHPSVYFTFKKKTTRIEFFDANKYHNQVYYILRNHYDFEKDKELLDYYIRQSDTLTDYILTVSIAYKNQNFIQSCMNKLLVNHTLENISNRIRITFVNDIWNSFSDVECKSIMEWCFKCSHGLPTKNMIMNQKLHSAVTYYKFITWMDLFKLVINNDYPDRQFALTYISSMLTTKELEEAKLLLTDLKK